MNQTCTRCRVVFFDGRRSELCHVCRLLTADSLMRMIRICARVDEAGSCGSPVRLPSIPGPSWRWITAFLGRATHFGFEHPTKPSEQQVKMYWDERERRRR